MSGQPPFPCRCTATPWILGFHHAPVNGASPVTAVRDVGDLDNVDAMRFIQRRCYRLVIIDPGAVDRRRRTKSAIPPADFHGIPINTN